MTTDDIRSPDPLKPRRHFAILLLALTFMLYAPVFMPDRIEGVVGPILLTGVLLSTLLVITDTRRGVALGSVLAVLACGLLAAAFLNDHVLLAVAAGGMAVLFLAIAVTGILRHVFRARHVDTGTILGALCVFLLAAVIWGEIYTLTELLQPGSFHFPSPIETRVAARSMLHYFSLVTISTVGYGDVYATTQLTRATAVTEAIFGQLYLVVLVSRLVGLHTADEARRKVME